MRGPAQTIFGNKNWASTVVGATPEYETAHNWPVADGRWFTAQEVRSSAKVVLLGNTVAEQLFEGGDPIGQTVRIKTVPFLVIGVLAAKGESLSGQDQDDVVVVPISTYRNRIQGGTAGKLKRIGSVSVKVREGQDMKVAEENIKGLLQQYDGQKQQELDQLVRIYSAMKPKEAAGIFETLDMPILLALVKQMKEAKVAPIMALMTPAKATALTEAITSRKQLSAAP